MRDINRIEPFLKQLGEQWKRYPDFRFMQFIMNIDWSGDPWFLEENEIIEIIKTNMDKTLGENKDE